MAAPNISARFEPGVGMVAELLFPEITLVGRFSAGFFWASKEGAFKGVVRRLHLDMLVTLERAPDGSPAIIVRTRGKSAHSTILVRCSRCRAAKASRTTF